MFNSNSSYEQKTKQLRVRGGAQLPKRKKGTRAAKSKTSFIGPRPTRLLTNEVVERGIPGFSAPRYNCWLNYYDNITTLTSGAGSAGTYVYSANGLYDPDVTSTGHQPMPFDQLMLSFEHYTVTGAEMICSFRNKSATNSACVSISAMASPTATTNIINLVENGVLVRTRLPIPPCSTSVQTLSLPIDIGKFGSVPDLLSNPDYNGSVAANPIEQSYFQISVWNPDSLVAATDVSVEVFIRYKAWFFEPRKNSASINRMIMQAIIADEKTRWHKV